MVLLTHQKEKNYFVSPELRRTGLKQIYGSKTLRWSFKRKQLETIQEQKPDYYFKIVLLGDCGTGKTNLANKFSCEACSKTSYVQKPAVGGGVKLVEYVDRVIEMPDKHVLARLYDTAGQEKFRSLTTSYYRGAHGCLLLFDVTSESTFNNVPYWLHDCKDYTSNTNIPAILVGTNCQVTDEQRKVSFERAAKYAESEGLPYMELSKDTDTSVMPLINRMLELVIESFNNDQILTKQQSDNVALEQKKTTKSTCAC